jgi:hypothetical protein
LSRDESARMINSVVGHLAQQLNQFFKQAYDLNEDIVVISNLLEQDGAIASGVSNKLVMFLTNIEKDTVPFRQPLGGAETMDGRAVMTIPPLYLNLYVMIAANFSGANYAEALKFISNAIAYFQRNPVFDHRNAPDLDSRIEKLILEIENLSIQDLSNLWSILSGKYLPSILYKVRMVVMDREDIAGQAPLARQPEFRLIKTDSKR